MSDVQKYYISIHRKPDETPIRICEALKRQQKAIQQKTLETV